MNVWGITDRGVIREQNQDAFAHQVLPDGRVLALVCDGMGGARAGNVASTMAVDIIMDEFLAEEERSRTLERLKAAAASANRRIFQRAAGEERCAGMGTTLVAADPQRGGQPGLSSVRGGRHRPGDQGPLPGGGSGPAGRAHPGAGPHPSP